jgi:uncharacterized membrane protein
MQKVYYNTALVAYFGLFILLMAWNTVLIPSTRIPVAMVLIFTITPLLLPLRGFLHGRSKSCSWMAYVSLIYLIHGIVETYANPSERLYAATEAVLALSLFLGATYYVRSLK